MADNHKFQTSKTMTDNVIPLKNLITTADIPVEKVLDGAKTRHLSEAVVLGWNEAGKFAFFSTTADLVQVSWLLRHAELFVNDHIRAQDE